MPRGTGLLIGTWAVLMVLLAVTVAAALLPIGPVKPAVNIAAAVIKAGLIWWVFMHLKEIDNFLRVMALAALVWVLLLGGMLITDVASRS